jgi:hypothetical protein
MARVVSPNNSGPVPYRAHPERDNAQDPRRPYDRPPETRTDGRGFVNTMMGGAGGMDRDSQPPSGARTDDTREFAKDAVEQHLRDHQHRSWQR